MTCDFFSCLFFSSLSVFFFFFFFFFNCLDTGKMTCDYFHVFFSLSLSLSLSFLFFWFFCCCFCFFVVVFCLADSKCSCLSHDQILSDDVYIQPTRSSHEVIGCVRWDAGGWWVTYSMERLVVNLLQFHQTVCFDLCRLVKNKTQCA